MKKIFLLGFISIIMVLTMAYMASAQPPCTDTTYFSFKGFVQNSSFTNVSGANVSIYNFSMVPNQPPIETLVNSTLTNANGFFNLSVPDGRCSIVFKVYAKQYYGSGNVSEISTNLPPMPKMAFTDMLNGGTFYLQPAATLRLSAINSSGNSTGFAYMVSDTSFGMPLADNFNSLVNTTDVTVQRNRNYTVLMVRPPTLVGADITTATPPITTTVNNVSNYSSLEYVVPVTLSLSYSEYSISGYVNVTGNTTRINLTKIIVRFTSSGMVPEEAVIQGLAQTILNQPGVSGYIANYSITVMGAPGGIEQLVEFYGENVTGPTSGGGEYFAFFQNFTVSSNINNFNITLTKLAGNYTTSSYVNTSMIIVNLTDGDTGGSLQDVHAEVSVVNSGNISTLRYMKDSLDSGIFKIPLLLDSNATLKVFCNKFAPLERKLNLTNITNAPTSPLLTITMKGFNMERMHGTNRTPSNFTTDSDIRVRFMRNSVACNVYEPDVATCQVGGDRDGGFNPLMAMMAGKTNLRIELPDSNATLYFIGVDLLASGPPDGVMSDEANEEATADKSLAQLWKFGSMAPDIYDEARIGIPYNESKMNESRSINITLRYLYDNDWNIIWNASNDPNATNIPSAYSDFNVTWFNISSTGMPCTSSPLSDCFINTSSNIIWMRIPHFSSGGYYINTSSVDQNPPRTNATLNNVNDTDGDGNINLAWTDDANETGESYRIYRHTNFITTEVNSSVTLIATNFPAGIQYYEDNTSTANTNYWYALVTRDWTGNYNESVVSNSLNATANDTIKPKLPTQVNATPSGGTTTITWTNVTQDVSNNYDLVRYTVWYWKNVTNYWNSTNWVLLNSSIATVLAANISARSTTHTINDFPNNESVRYYYFVTTIDDANTENLTYNTANMNLSVVSATTCTNGVAIPSDGCSCGGVFYKSGYCCSSAFSASACTTTTAGGGGGGGGGVTTSYSTSHKWATVLGGALTAMSIDNTNIAFTKMQFLSTSTLSNAEIKVTALTSQPSDITKTPEDTLYQYLNVETTNMPSDKLSSTMIYFRIPKSWVNSNNIDYKTIKLSRYENNNWNKLITTLTSTDDTYYHYSASTSGFSYFAITGIKKEEVVGEAPEAEEGVPGITNVTEAKAPEEKERIVSRAWLGWLIVILIIGGIVVGVYFYQKKRAKPTYGFEQ